MEIRDESGDRNNFTMVPNFVYRLGMSAYAVALYGYIKQAAGEKGRCFKATDTISKDLQIGAATVSRAKHELELNGLIRINEVPSGRGKPYHSIAILDVWQRNAEHINSHKADSTEEHESSHQELISSPVEIIKNHLIKNPERESESKNDSPAPPPEIEKPEEKPIPPSGGEIDFPPVQPRERVSVEERRARLGAAAEIGAENVRRGKKKGVADPWEQSAADAKEWGLQVASVVMGEDVTAEAIAHLPRDFRSTMGYKGRDIQADIDGGCVPREMYVKAFEYYRNGGRAAIGEPVTPNRVMKQIVAYVMNGGKPPTAPGATSYYGKPFDRNARSPDEIERERREADSQSELYWKRRREFEAAQAREFHDLSGTDVSPA